MDGCSLNPKMLIKLPWNLVEPRSWYPPAGSNWGVGLWSLSTLRACLEVLAGEHSYSYTLDRRPVLSSSWKGHPLWPRESPMGLRRDTHSLGRDTHWSVMEEGDTHLASQISWINPGDQWGDRCCSQITLTSGLWSLWKAELNCGV